MTDLNQRLEAFVKLGDFLRNFCEILKDSSANHESMDPKYEDLSEKVSTAKHQNGWFTHENIVFAIEHWGKLLTKDQLRDWVLPYNISKQKEKTVAIIMAGNIPLVGFHDFLVTLISGNKALIKLSSNDTILLPAIVKELLVIAPELTSKIHFETEQLTDFDAVIATGSNNTARYFEYYFGNKPNVIRKNRKSLAVLTGQESKAELHSLGEDIFRYYGLGCRSVSKLMVPEGYNFDAFFEAVYPFKSIIDGAKYANNYDYNKAITQLDQHKNQIQCIVAKGFSENEIAFGGTQQPQLADYADAKDTMAFLLKT